MKAKSFCLALTILLGSLRATGIETELPKSCDVIVVGGGVAGVAAAVQSARAGVRTVLVEQGFQVGGTMTSGGVDFPGLFHAWGRQVIDGAAYEIVTNCVALAGGRLPDFSRPTGPEHWKHQIQICAPLYVALAEEALTAAGARICYHTAPVSIVQTERGWKLQLSGLGEIWSLEAKQVIDCTGNASIAFMAGFEREGAEDPQPGSFVYLLDPGCDVNALDHESLNRAYEKALQDGRLKPYDTRWGIVQFLRMRGGTGNYVVGADNSSTALRTDTNIRGRASMLRMFRFVRSQAGLQNAKLIGMSAEVGVRETYRIKGEYAITVDDYVTGRVHPDSLCYAFYPVDMHQKDAGVSPCQLKEPLVPTVPLRALVPRRAKNFLVAGRSVSSDRVANAGLRVEAACMAMGQVAGEAAAFAACTGVSPLELPLPELRRRLERSGAIVPPPKPSGDSQGEVPPAAFSEDLANYVNPFIGTDGPGHSHPAASCPFGMVQAGPDTGTLAWDYCSGYQYRDKAVLGYSQNHLNGTGCPDFGDIQVLPFSGELGKLPVKRTIDKSTEKASPGWYEVRQPDDGVKVEISATARAALYRFTWDRGRTPQVLVNLPFMLEESWTHSAILGSDVKTAGATVIKGSVDKTGWLKRKVSFVLEFNRPWKRLSELPRDSKAPRYVASFDESDGNVVMMRVAISHHDLAGAERNLVAEMPGWNIEGVRAAARRAWNGLFERSVCEGTDEEKINWYTSLYHLYLQPNVYSDIGEEEHYTTLSLWDTARAAQPWYSLVTPDLNDKVIASLGTLYRRDGYLPSLAYGGGNGGGMVGFHSIPVLVDWALKNRGRQNCQDKDLEEIFAAVKATLTVKHPNRSKEDWDIYDRYGYYPYDLIRGESVSRTMECAYDDWCAAQLAKALGMDADAAFFMERSSRWQNVIDTSIGLARGKDTKGRWRDPFDPYAFGHGADTANDFTECNAFQYTWHVLHDVEGLANAFGGADKLAERIDSIFSLPEVVRGPGLTVDVSGLIGQYVHGNEPCHHIPYFYPQLGHPEKAAERIRQICDKFYRPKPDGLCGNDDCGQMSAWYLFSAMGFYPFNPCGGEYIIGAPQVPCVKVEVGGQGRERMLTVLTRGLSRENKHVKSVSLNGKPIKDWKIRHADIVAGGELAFEMGE